MSDKPSPRVEMTKLSKGYSKMHLEPKLMKDARKIFEKVTANHLSYLPRLNNEEINKDFPEDLPNYLLWPGKSLFPVEKKPAIKQEFLAEIEAEEIIEHTPTERRRRPRYNGTYNVESLTATTSKVVTRKKTTSVSSETSRASTPKPQQSKRRDAVSESSEGSKASTSKPPAKRKKTFSESSGSSSMSKACSSVQSVAPLKLKISTSVGESLRRIPCISSSSSSSSDCSPDRDSPLHGFKANGQPSLQKTKALRSSSSSSSSGSSSDSSDEEIKKIKKKERSAKKKQPALKESKLMKVSRRLALNTPKVVNQNPKPFVKEAPKADKELNGLDAAVTKAPTATSSKRQTLEKPTVVKQKAKKFEKPQIVEAPKMDPKTNKPITQEALDKQKLKRIARIPKKENPLQKLGGIFTVENGWEKTEEAAKIAEKPKVPSPVNIEPETIRTPPLPVIGPSSSAIAPEQFVRQPSRPLSLAQVNRKPRSPIRAPSSGISFVKAGEVPVADVSESGTNKFNRHRDSDSSDEEPLEDKLKPSASSSSSSSESENEGDQESSAKAEDEPTTAGGGSGEAEAKSPKAESKKTANEDSSSSSSDEERKDETDRENSPKRASSSDQEDILELVDDFELDYEDDDEKDANFEPPKALASKSAPKVAPKAEPVIPEEHFTAELDELKLTLRKEEPARITAPKEDTKSEFDRNTEEIMAKIAPPVDNGTRRILQQFFGNICIDFLEDNCPLPDSACKHFLPDANFVAQRLDRCALSAVDEGFNVALQFPKLLMTYFGQFAEQFVKKAFMPMQDESRLARMVMECEKNARTHALYRTIAGALSNVAQMPPYKAARFIINNHTDSPYAREIIVQMIISTGPDLIRNIRYLEGIAASQTVPTALLDKILANCVTYQDPALPNLCLNLMMNLQPKQVNELQPENVEKLLNLQLELTSKNEERETKAAHVALIVAQKPKQRPPPNI